MYKYPAPGLIIGIEAGISGSPLLFSLLCDLTSRRSTRRLLKPTRRISSSRLRDSYVFDFLIARSLFRSHRLPYQRNVPKLLIFTFDKSSLDSSTPCVLTPRTRPRTFFLSYPLITELSSTGYHLRYILAAPERQRPFSSSLPFPLFPLLLKNLDPLPSVAFGNLAHAPKTSAKGLLRAFRPKHSASTRRRTATIVPATANPSSPT